MNRYHDSFPCLANRIARLFDKSIIFKDALSPSSELARIKLRLPAMESLTADIFTQLLRSLRSPLTPFRTPVPKVSFAGYFFHS
jgi:hypothetical protein